MQHIEYEKHRTVFCFHLSSPTQNSNPTFYTMPNQNEDDLPAVFAQPTVQNERISSLLSAVFFRRIRPSFTNAIRRHPLSMWTLEESNRNEYGQGKHSIPFVLFLGPSNDGTMKNISSLLKREVRNSGLMVAEQICDSDRDQQGNTTTISLDIIHNFHPDASVFIIDLCSDSLHVNYQGSKMSCIKGVVSLNPRSGGGVLSVRVPKLVLVPNGGDTLPCSQIAVQSHSQDPYTITVALPCPVATYEDDAAHSLWLARTVLKWIKAVELIQSQQFGRSKL